MVTKSFPLELCVLHTVLQHTRETCGQTEMVKKHTKEMICISLNVDKQLSFTRMCLEKVGVSKERNGGHKKQNSKKKTNQWTFHSFIQKKYLACPGALLDLWNVP